MNALLEQDRIWRNLKDHMVDGSVLIVAATALVLAAIYGVG